MCRLSSLLVVVPAALAFQSPMAPQTPAIAMKAASKALPFMEAPAALDGTYAGDVGFDPVGFTEVFDIKWLREAEIKHGRVCMVRLSIKLV